MTRKCIAILTVLATAMSAAADLTNTWEFTNSSAYYIPYEQRHLIQVDVTQGVARLVLQAKNVADTTMDEYNASDPFVSHGWTRHGNFDFQGWIGI